MSKKVSIVFHSVCGNNYLIAKEFYDEFIKLNIYVNIYRVNDTNYEFLADQFDASKEYKEEILKIDIASPEKLLDSDLIILGSPTYYGNVSGAMKIFMDSFSPHWTEAKFWGKKLFSYTTCANSDGGGDLCLTTMNIFGFHMGMIPVPIPSNLIEGKSHTAYGLVHFVGNESSIRPDSGTIASIQALAAKLIKL